MNRLELHVPTIEELDYRQRIMSDPKTMSYNKGYDLDFDGYHKDTGCIDFPESEWLDWYEYFVGCEPERFYAYARRKEDGVFIGEVNVHKSSDEDYDMGILIEAKYRGQSYSREALNLLLKHSFEEMGVKAVHNVFEEERDAAMKVHLDCGFREVRRENGIIHLMITADEYGEI